MQIVSVFSIKGGEGKSTLSIVTADYLASRMNKRVLLVDLDAQGSVSDHYKPDRVDVWQGRSLRTLCAHSRGEALNSALKEIILRSVGSITPDRDNIDIIPAAGYNLSELKSQEEMTSEDKLLAANNFFDAVRSLNYDYVVFDTPPAQPFNVIPYLSRSDRYLIPLIPISLSRTCLQSTLEAIKLSQSLRPPGMSPPETVVVFSKVRPDNDHKNGIVQVEKELETTAVMPNVRSVRSRSATTAGLLLRNDLELRNEGQQFSKFRPSAPFFTGAKYPWSHGVVAEAIGSALDLHN